MVWMELGKLLNVLTLRILVNFPDGAGRWRGTIMLRFPPIAADYLARIKIRKSGVLTSVDSKKPVDSLARYLADRIWQVCEFSIAHWMIVVEKRFWDERFWLFFWNFLVSRPLCHCWLSCYCNLYFVILSSMKYGHRHGTSTIRYGNSNTNRTRT